MSLLIDLTVLSGLVIACLFASSPTRTSSDLNATIEGVVLFPSAFAITVGSPPSSTATTPVSYTHLTLPTTPYV